MANPQATNMEVKKNNRNRIFRYLCKCDKASNPEISYELKISLPTVTQNTKELIERGLVEEVGELQSTGGRRAKALTVAADSKLAVGLDITKNHIGLVLVSLTGKILRYNRISQLYAHSSDYYQEVNDQLELFIEESGVKEEQILGIGISFPGIVDTRNRRITYSHILGVSSVPLESISCFFSHPCSFLNDANAGAYAEGIRSEKPDRFFYLSLSNTVGGAVFSHDGLVEGREFRCGEVGHMTIIPGGIPCYCKKQGCLDAYCSAKRLSDRTDGRLEAFFQRLKEGEEELVRVWEEYTTYLSIAINNIYMVLDCEIILGGYVGCCMGEHIQDIWTKVSKRNTFAENSSFVKASHYKVEAAAVGAALRVVETFIEQV